MIKKLAIAFALSFLGLAVLCSISYAPMLIWGWQTSQAWSAMMHSDWKTAEKNAAVAVFAARYLNKEKLLQSMNLLVVIYTSQGKYALATPVLEEWLQTARSERGPHSVELIRALAISGGFYRRQAQYTRAAQEYKKALESASHGVPPGDPAIIDVDYALAKLDVYLGKTKEARTLLERTLQLAQSQSPPDAMRADRAMAGLGDLEEWAARYKSAQSKYEQAIQTSGREAGEKAEFLDHLVPLYLAEGKASEAKQTALAAQALVKPTDGLAYMNTSDTIVNVNVAAVYTQLGDYAQAQPLISDVLHQLAMRVSDQHPGYANALILEARLETQLGHFDKAEAFFNQAQPIIEKTCGKRHRFVAELMRRRAELEMAKGQYQTAEQDFNQAIDIAKSSLPPDHPQIAGIMKSYATLLGKLGRMPDAERLNATAQQMLARAESL